MVSLQCVNVAIYMNLLYRTIAWHIQLFLLLIAERGNWLSVWVADAPGYGLETQRGPIIDELSQMVQRPNHLDGGGKPESTKGSKNLVFEKGV